MPQRCPAADPVDTRHCLATCGHPDRNSTSRAETVIINGAVFIKTTFHKIQKMTIIQHSLTPFFVAISIFLKILAISIRLRLSSSASLNARCVRSRCSSIISFDTKSLHGNIIQASPRMQVFEPGPATAALPIDTTTHTCHCRKKPCKLEKRNKTQKVKPRKEIGLQSSSRISYAPS